MIVVTTPNGNIGKIVLRQLVERGESVRVISYRPDRIPEDLRPRCEVIAGSLDDPSALEKGFAGAESIFWCVPQSHEWSDAGAYYGSFYRPAVTALRNRGAKAPPRLVTISSGGYGVANAGPVSALHRMEDALNATGAPMRHLRCGNFMENLFWSLPSIKTQGAIFQPVPGGTRFPLVCSHDIATQAVSHLTDKAWRDQSAVAVHGAEDLSYDEISAVLTDVLKTPVRYVRVPHETTRGVFLQMGASEGFADAYCAMFRAFADGAYGREPRTPETTTPTTLREWAARSLLPALG